MALPQQILRHLDRRHNGNYTLVGGNAAQLNSTSGPQELAELNRAAVAAQCEVRLVNGVLVVASPGIIPSVSAGGVAVKVASTLAGLGSGTNDGDIGIIRVGTYPTLEQVVMTWDANSGHWIGEPFSLVNQVDQGYMGTNTTAYSYISTNQSGAATTTIGWSSRPVVSADLLYAAGLKLQTLVSAIMVGASGPAVFTVMPYLFNHNANDAVVFSSDGSTASAQPTALVSDNASTPASFKSTGWTDIFQLGTSNPATSAQITKTFLWPRLYGKVASGVTYGGVIDLDMQARWVG